MQERPRLRVREMRTRQALSQLDLAARSGVDHKTISGVETGRRAPQPRTLRKLAEALDAEPEQLWMTQAEETGKVPVAIPPTQTAKRDALLGFGGRGRLGGRQ